MRSTILLCFFSLSTMFFGQNVSAPSLWIKASSDSLILNTFDTSATSASLVWNGDRAALSSSFVNGYPSLKILNNHSDGGFFSLSTDILRGSSNLIFLIAYEPSLNRSSSDTSSIEEQGLWSFFNGDTTFLTSHHYGKSDSRFRYCFRSYPGSVVTSNLLFATSKVDSSSIVLGKSDSLMFRGKLSEFIILKNVFSDNFRQAWHSYLAIKYGATLYDSDYLNSAGDTIWHYRNNQNFSAGVGAIGRDNNLTFCQSFSTISGDSLRVSYAGRDEDIQRVNPSLSDKEYVFWGHNAEPPTVGSVLYPIDNKLYYLYNRIWKIRNKTAQNPALDFRINIPSDMGMGERLKMFVAKEPNFLEWSTLAISPSRSINNSVCFSGFNLSDSVVYLTFGYEKNVLESLNFNHNANNQPFRAYGINAQNSTSQVFTEASYLPNPVEDNLYVDYKLKNEASIRFSLFDNNGMAIYQTSSETKPRGANRTIIPMSRLIAGTYLLYIHVDNIVLNTVIIKK